MLKKTYRWISNLDIRFITESPDFFVWIMLLFLLNAILFNVCHSENIIGAAAWVFATLFIMVLFASIFKLINDWISTTYKLLGGAFRVIIFTLLIIPLIIEAFLVYFFHTPITSVIVAFVLQTKPSEAKGFFQAFIFNSEFLTFALYAIFIAIASWGLKRIICYLIKKYPKPCSWCIMVGVCGSLAFVSIPQIRKTAIEKIPISACGRIGKSYYEHAKTIRIGTKINDDTGIVSFDHKERKIIVIIGESFNKWHSSLYGYSKETNPVLKKIQASGNLFLFKQVNCPYNATNKMLRSLLSLHSVDSKENWENYPIFPHIFKEANYHVTFISNQITSLNADGCTEDDYFAGSYFFQDPLIAKRSFDYRNNKTYKYDLDLLNELNYALSFRKNKELILIQLVGQHIYAKHNFPQEDKFFCIEDYSSTQDFALSERQRHEIADYDNAIRYNDKVVSAIIDRYKEEEAIIIYLSDHGEEVHDYRAKLGRSYSLPKTGQEIKYQYQVPFMIYVSDRYKSANPEVVANIKNSLNKPFMSDDLSHILLGLSGINCKWYDPERDLLSPLYNQERVLRIEDSQIISNGSN